MKNGKYHHTTGLLTGSLKLVGMDIKYLFKGYMGDKAKGARFADPSSYRDFLNHRHQGLLLDGDCLHLSESSSFQNVCIMARVGAGKTSRYIIPNVLDKARQPCSMVVNDPKGEVFSQTSARLQQCGYKIVVIDPENLNCTSYFNPLTEAKSDIELEQIAEILVRSGVPSGQGKDDFWLQGAMRFVSLFIKCLKNAGQDNPAWFNFYYLFQNFGQDGSALDGFMSRYTIYPQDPTDESLWHEWRGVQTGNKEGIQSFVLNARYGKDYADSIQGGFNTYMTYAGADPQTTDFFEKMIGRVRERQKRNLFDGSPE